MTKHTGVVRIVGLLIAGAAMLSIAAPAAAAGGPPTDAAHMTGARAVVTGTLDADEQAILDAFLLDEHKALATYKSVMTDFGEMAPFTAIARAEEQHITALERIYARYDAPLPEVTELEIPSFESPEAAAAASVQAEIDNAALYDRLLSGIDNPDIVRVASNLRDASLNNHLPAFQAFADGSYTEGVALGSQRMVGGSGTGTSQDTSGVGPGQGRGTGRRGATTRATGGPADRRCLEQ